MHACMYTTTPRHATPRITSTYTYTYTESPPRCAERRAKKKAKNGI